MVNVCGARVLWDTDRAGRAHAHTCAVDLLRGGRIVRGDVQRHVFLLVYCRGSSAEPATLRRGVDVGVASLLCPQPPSLLSSPLLLLAHRLYNSLGRICLHEPIGVVAHQLFHAVADLNGVASTHVRRLSVRMGLHGGGEGGLILVLFRIQTMQGRHNSYTAHYIQRAAHIPRRAHTAGPGLCVRKWCRRSGNALPLAAYSSYWTSAASYAWLTSH